MSLLVWITRFLISISAGVGSACVTFAIFALTTGDSEAFAPERINMKGPPLVPSLFALAVGFFTVALLMWILTRKLPQVDRPS